MAAEHCASLAEIRERIDALDRSIERLLCERGEYVLRAAAFKRDALDVRAPRRAAQVIENASREASRAGFDQALIGRIYEAIVAAFTDAEMNRCARK